MIDKSMRYAYRYGGHPGGGYAGSSSSSSSSSGGEPGGGGGPPNRNFVSSPPPTQAKAPTVSDRVSPQQSMAMKGDISLAGKTQDEAQASVDRDNKLEQKKKAMQGRVIYRKPIELPTPKKPVLTQTSGTGPFNRDDRDYQDKIRQVKSKIEFDPNLSNEEKVERNKILDDFVYKGTRSQFAAKPKKSTGRRVLEGLFSLATMGQSDLARGLRAANTARKAKKYADDLGITQMVSDKFNLSDRPKIDRTNNISNVQDTRDGIQSNIISGGGDVVSQKVKEFTGEPTVEKVTEQPSDSQRSQLLKLLQQLQQYNSQNRLNEKGKQTLAQLMSFMNQPITGRSRDI